MNTRRHRLLLLALMCSAISLVAQTFRGGVSGVVRDASGSPIPGASVQLVGTGTGLTRSATTSSAGDFAFQDLPLGKYELTVLASGFDQLKIGGIPVEAGRVINLPVNLEVAKQATTVEVAASPVAIDTASSTLTSVIPTKAIQDIPLNGRDFTQLLKLSPGATPANSLNGTRTNAIDWQIDGADNNDLWHNSAAVNQGGVSGVAGTLLPIDAIDQFSLQSNSSAENGRNGGGTLNLVIKSGTNDFHGSAYYFNRNEFLAARSWFADPTAPNPALRNNQFGGSLGGPVLTNHTFFFLTYEEQLFTAGNSNQDTTPSHAWVSTAENVLNHYGVPVNPLSLNMLSFWPDATRQGALSTPNYFSTASNDYNSYNGIVKLDHIFNERNNIAIRYFGGTGSQTAYVGSALKDYYQVAPSRMHNFSFVYNTVLSPRWTNQILAGVNYFKQTFGDFNTGFNPVALGLNTGVTNPTLFGAPDITINGFSETGITPPLGRIDTTGHLDEIMTYTVGAHQFRMGAEYRRARLDVFYDRNQRGVFSFDGSQGPWAGVGNSTFAALFGVSTTDASSLKALSDFMAGYVAAGKAHITYGDLQRNYYINSTSAFFEDSWKASSKLTLNYGVNWNYSSPPSDPTDRISTFIPSLGGIVYAGHGIDTIYPRDWNNFAPRFGFAFQPKAGGRLVVRGGYGIFYQVPNMNYFGDNRPGNGGATGVLSNPGTLAPVYAASNPTELALQSGVPIFGSTSLPSPPFGAFSIDQNFRTGYVQNFNTNIQYQLSQSTVLQIGYAGSLSRKLPVTLDINQIPLGAGSQTARPYYSQFPTLGAINQVESAGNAHYNGGSVSLRSSGLKGITTQLNYTYGHARDDLSGARGYIPQNSYNLRGEWGNSDYDIRHSFSGFISYSFPNPGRAKLLLGGWQLNSLLTFYTGQPFTVNAGQDVSNTRENNDRVNVIGNPLNAAPAAIPHQAVYWFNPTPCGTNGVTTNCFALAAPGTYGNEPRNEFYGPNTYQVDFSVFKNTPITERVTTQLRLEMFNIFNTRDLAPPTPGTTPPLAKLTSSGFGQITSTLGTYNGAPGIGTGEPFNIQLALKILF
jgi:Carboxypeptidase regulatory-like domain